MKYVIQFGIALYFEKQLQDEYYKKLFTFKFDETTNHQVKKQYDGYVQFRCVKSQCIKISYCGTLTVDHCPAEKLVEHFEFIKKANLDLKYILHIGMDGPSVNLKFEKLLIDQLNKLILQIGTCPLHIVHNSFRYGILALSFDVDRCS